MIRQKLSALLYNSPVGGRQQKIDLDYWLLGACLCLLGLGLVMNILPLRRCLLRTTAATTITTLFAMSYMWLPGWLLARRACWCQYSVGNSGAGRC